MSKEKDKEIAAEIYYSIEDRPKRKKEIEYPDAWQADVMDLVWESAVKSDKLKIGQQVKAMIEKELAKNHGNINASKKELAKVHIHFTEKENYIDHFGTKISFEELGIEALPKQFEKQLETREEIKAYYDDMHGNYRIPIPNIQRNEKGVYSRNIDGEKVHDENYRTYLERHHKEKSQQEIAKMYEDYLQLGVHRFLCYDKEQMEKSNEKWQLKSPPQDIENKETVTHMTKEEEIKPLVEKQLTTEDQQKIDEVVNQTQIESKDVDNNPSPQDEIHTRLNAINEARSDMESSDLDIDCDISD